ncbi:hypothetical protein GCM10023195_44440 [Actinoallomurus liliacearum]|uniref:Alpha/beta hydrolase n=1 Tax=Actinoallomurus liliacearum TaxID=1080073 RepID=A0ABP8TQ03_9ACTN
MRWRSRLCDGESTLSKPCYGSPATARALRRKVLRAFADAALGHSAYRLAAAKPTIVLIHGAWAGASSLAPVASRLQRDGYTVLDAPMPEPARRRRSAHWRPRPGGLPYVLIAR